MITLVVKEAEKTLEVKKGETTLIIDGDKSDSISQITAELPEFILPIVSSPSKT